MLTQTGMFLAAMLAGGGYTFGWIKGRAGGLKKAMQAMGQHPQSETVGQPITLVQPAQPAALPQRTVIVNGDGQVLRNLQQN